MAIIASMRARESVRAQTYDAIGHGTGNRDAMRATDSRMDAEKSAASEIRDLSDQVKEGRELCRGIRAANITQRWADALELHYIEDMTWHQTASALGVSERQAQVDVSCALDWVDSVGMARARTGLGQAAIL